VTEEVMLRKTLSLIALVGFVAGQWATAPHSHGECGELFDHGDRPHFHIGQFARHDHCQHGAHASQNESDRQHSERHGHDSSAVYLPDDLSVSLPRKAASTLDNVQTPAAMGAAPLALAIVASDSPTAASFPEELNPACPLYLAVRALRI
jgi:hypothetical protein